MGSALTKIDEIRQLLSADCITEHSGQVVISPRTTAELAAVARYASSNSLPIEIAGAGTKRDWGNPVSAQIVLKTTGLAGVNHHSWQDLTATVRAGTPWAAMQQALAMHNQQVALDPLWPETATIGGIVATNDAGALRLKYGSLRDLIIGMTIVLTDGTIAKSGGKVVKNVAGYDLHKLMTGAYGTLGVIAEVTFRLHPIPAHTRVWTISSGAAEPIGKLLMKVLDSQLTPQAMQLRARSAGFELDVELAGLPEVLDTQIAILDRLAAADGGFAQLTVHAPFTAREGFFATPQAVVIKATMLPAAIAKTSAEVVRLGGTAVTQATGIMHARFSEAAAAQALPGLYAYLDGLPQSSITILRAPSKLDPLRRDKASPLMREIKRQFDPNRILNPGRFLGGI